MYSAVKPEQAPGATVYPVSPTRRRRILLLYAITPILLGLFLLLLFDPHLPWSMAPLAFKLYMLVIVGIVAAYSCLLLIDRLRLRLVLSQKGIAYLGIGYGICSPWENIAGTGVRTVTTEMRGMKRAIWGLTLSQPAPVLWVRIWARFLPGWRDAEACFIPLSDFAGYPDSLSQHIRSYLPSFESW